VLGLQNAAPTPERDAAIFETLATERPPTEQTRRRLLRASVTLAALVFVAAAISVWRPQITAEWNTLESPVKQQGVVVLPFENDSGRDADAYLSEGFSDELRDQLSRVRGLRVVARPSSVVFSRAKQTRVGDCERTGRRNRRRGQLA
jgi:hypothetical protein